VPRLRAVLFDIDDTLFSTSEFAGHARRNAMQAMIEHGLNMDLEEAIRELDEVIAEFSSNYPSHFDKLLLRIPSSRYAGVNRAILVAAAIKEYHDTKSRELRPFPEVLGTFQLLSRTDLIIGIISAGLEIKQAEKLVRLGLYPFLTPTAIFISDQIGISKPNVKIYQTVCASLSIEPGELMYVGDNPFHDIDPCNRLGIITVRTRRGSRYSTVEGETKPRYEIESMNELLDILWEDFEIPLLPARKPKS